MGNVSHHHLGIRCWFSKPYNPNSTNNKLKQEKWRIHRSVIQKEDKEEEIDDGSAKESKVEWEEEKEDEDEKED